MIGFLFMSIGSTLTQRAGFTGHPLVTKTDAAMLLARNMDEQEKYEHHKQYRKVEAAYESGERNGLLTIYEQEFQKRYKVKPIYIVKGSQFSAMEKIQSLAKEAGAPVEDAIKTFLKHDTWFPKGHELGTLIKNFSLINVELAKTKPKRAENEKIQKNLVWSTYQCDKCKNPFICQIDLNEIENRTSFICDQCSN